MIAFYLVIWLTGDAIVSEHGPIYVNKTASYGPMQMTECNELAKSINEIKNDFVQKTTVHAVCRHADDARDYLNVLRTTIPPQ